MPYIEYARGKAKRKILPSPYLYGEEQGVGESPHLYGEEQGAGEQGE